MPDPSSLARRRGFLEHFHTPKLVVAACLISD
jgi:hypothetical protein